MNKNIKTALIIGGIIVAIPVILPTVFGAIYGWQGYGYGMMGGYGGIWFMPIFMIIFWGLIIWVFVTPTHGWSGGESALEILKRRYARGEITKEEYEERKKDLI